MAEKTLSLEEFQSLPDTQEIPVSSKKTLSLEEFQSLEDVETAISSGAPGEYQFQSNVHNVLNKGDRDFFDNMKESFDRGNDSSHIDIMSYEALTGRLNYDTEVKPIKIDYEQRVTEDPVEGENFLSNAIYSVAGMVPAMAKGTLEGLKYGAPAAAVTALVPGLQRAAPTVFRVGSTVGSASYWYRQGAGSLYSTLKDEDIEDEIAVPISHIGGAIYGAIEFSQVSKFIPGTKESIKKIAANKTRTVIKKLVKRYGANWVQEVGEEGLQEVVMSLSEDIAREAAGKAGNVKEQMVANALMRGWGAVKESAIPMLLLLTPKAAIETRAALKKPKAKKPKAFDEAVVKDLEQNREIKKKKKPKMIREAAKVIDKVLVPISTRLRKINPKLKNALRRYEFDVNKHILEDEKAVKPFLDKMEKLSEKDFTDLDLAMKNGMAEVTSEIIKRNEMTSEYNALRKVLNRIYSDAKKVGYKIGYLKDYAPRRVRDAEEFIEYIYANDTDNTVRAAIEKKEMEVGRKLEDPEIAALINSLLRGYTVAGIQLSRPGFLKERGIDRVTPELNQFYYDTQAAIVDYIYSVNDAVAARKFFGKHVQFNDKANPITYAYHGTQSVDIVGVPKTNNGKMGKAFYLSNDKIKATRFGKEKVVEDNIIDANGKVIKRTYREPNAYEETNIFTYDLSKLNIKEITDKEFFEQVKYEKPEAYYTLAGYDGVFNKDTGTYAIYSPSNLEKIKDKEGSIYDFNLESTIGAYVLDLLRNGEITLSQELELKEILTARFSPKGPGALLAGLKNLGYITTMGNPISAITQIGDLAFAYYKGGAMRSTASLMEAVTGKSKITKEDIGIERIAQEFSEGSKVQKFLTKTFKLVGLEWMDRIGKQTLINASYKKYKSQVKGKVNPELKSRLKEIFGEETNEVIDDFRNDRVSENVKMLLFSDLADLQPIAMSEMPQGYLRGGNGRVLYMLKTYTVKMWDVYHNEVFLEKNQVDAAKNFVSLTMALILMNATADQIKNWILGRETDFGEMLFENMLRLMGFSKFAFYEAKREGITRAIAKGYLIPPLEPFNTADLLIKDITRAVKDGEISLDQLDVIQRIPFGGKLYYWWFGRGREKAEKKKKKTRRR